MRTLLHVDMDAFFAAVELRRRPELQGKPLVVGGRGDPLQRGVVSTASYEARRFGIRSGMPLRTAYHHCPEAVFLPVDYDAYAAVSKQVRTILRDYSTNIEAIGLDEAFLDISGRGEAPEAVARSIKHRIKAQTGLTCSVGIGPNKLLAKIASDLDKPDGLTRLTEADIPRRVWPLPVRKLWGVGPKTEARLAELGARSIGELAALPLETLQQSFGSAHGRHLYQAAHGIDDLPVVPHRPQKSIGCETTFQQDISDRMRLLAALGGVCRKAHARLRQSRCQARTVTLKLRFADFETHMRAITLPEATDEAAIIEAAARDCLQRNPPAKPVRLLGIRLSRLEPAGRCSPPCAALCRGPANAPPSAPPPA